MDSHTKKEIREAHMSHRLYVAGDTDRGFIRPDRIKFTRDGKTLVKFDRHWTDVTGRAAWDGYGRNWTL